LQGAVAASFIAVPVSSEPFDLELFNEILFKAAVFDKPRKVDGRERARLC
jgi:hypothetical protein